MFCEASRVRIRDEVGSGPASGSAIQAAIKLENYEHIKIK